MDLEVGVRAGVVPVRRWLGVLLLSIVAVFGATSCGASTPLVTAGDTSSRTPIVSESTTTAGPPRNAMVLYYDRNADTHTATVKVILGDLKKATEGVVNGGARLGDACEFDAKTDAVVPFSIVLVNTTPGRNLPGAVAWELSRGADGDSLAGRFSMELAYSTPECETGVERVLASMSVREIPSNAGVRIDGLVVIRDYFPPNHPDGDPGIIKGVTLNIKFVELGPESKMQVTGPPNPEAGIIPLVLD